MVDMKNLYQQKHYHPAYWLMVLIIGFSHAVFGQQNNAQQLRSSSQADTWTAVDGLGRKLPVSGKGLRKDRYVGIFYFIWQGAHGYDGHGNASKNEGVSEKLPGDTISPYDITKLIKENPTNPKYGPVHAFHYWGEPYFGYYLPDDEWIIRKHTQMLSDAGVDVLILDVTNAAIYLPQITKIAEVYKDMRSKGLSTPSLAFIVNSKPAETVQRLYKNIYKKGLFKEFWFQWKGKPLLLCPPEAVTPEIAEFFSVRQSWAWSKDQKWFADGKDKWPWLDHTPQSYGWHESPKKAEEMSVALAEHPMSNIGRSFHDGKEPEKKQPGAGLYFAEQWKRALQTDPEFVFVTGWNEWVAMRFTDGAAKNMMGKPIVKGDTYFVDLYNAEYSRDAEPVKGDFNDNYYYQLVDGIRRFKGMRPVKTFTEKNTVKIDGRFDDWDKVTARYTDDAGDTLHRNHPGWGRIKAYTNTSGRNDITEARITHDRQSVYFYVKTAGPLSAWNSENWMRLFIRLPQSNRPAWESFHYLVNRKPVTKTTSTIEKNAGGWKWSGAGEVKYRVQGNELEMAVPKKSLGIGPGDFTLDFKWADNSPPDGNPMHWLDKGDAAPNARFTYRYTYKKTDEK